MADDKCTLVEDGTEFKGTLSSKCPIVVKGKVEGEVSAPSMKVSPTGAVHGRARVADLRSEGELSGEFDADTVQLSGRVRDKTVIRAKSLDVKLSPDKGKMQVVFGECTLEVGEEPARAEDAPKPPVTRASAAPPPDDFGPLLSRSKAPSEPAPPNGGSIPPVG
ncbi:MAG TPA: polymer-forming cytoskeletal protein [Minicystis sp.]|nr:polymer-forming cytoskeletal protein [Minicystis sp.]